MRRLLSVSFLLLSFAGSAQSVQVLTETMLGPLDTALLRSGRIRVLRDSLFFNGNSYSGFGTYELDPGGRIYRIAQRDTNSKVISDALLSYDSFGSVQRIELEQMHPASKSLYTAQTFRSGGRTDSILFQPEGSRLVFRYSPEGRLLEKELTWGPRRPGEKERTLFLYDSLGRISIVEKRSVGPYTKADGRISSLRIYQYAGGRLLEETETMKGHPMVIWGGTVHYTYDAAGRLVEWQEENRKKLQYWYYPDGQLQRVREVFPGDDFFIEHRYSYGR